MAYDAIIQVMQYGKITNETIIRLEDMTAVATRFPALTWVNLGNSKCGASSRPAHDKLFIRGYELKSTGDCHARNVQAYILEEGSEYVAVANAHSVILNGEWIDDVSDEQYLSILESINENDWIWIYDCHA